MLLKRLGRNKMIKELSPLTIAEVVKLAGDTEKEEKLKVFIKQFVKISADKAKEMREELKNLNLIKLKEEHIVKIVDFMPEDAFEVTKILPGIALTQDEITKILEIVKKY